MSVKIEKKIVGFNVIKPDQEKSSDNKPEDETAKGIVIGVFGQVKKSGKSSQLPLFMTSISTDCPPASAMKIESPRVSP